MAQPCEPVRPALSAIGLVAYCALPPHHVFVRVPNERGRWMLTHRCVVDVGCTQCGAVAGEPCFNWYAMTRASQRIYHISTHSARRDAYRAKWRRRAKEQRPHKPVIRPSDIEEAEAPL